MCFATTTSRLWLGLSIDADDLLGKLERHQADIESYQALDCEDAEILIVAYGITSRAARRARRELRQEGKKVGLFRPITLWPFPEEALRQAAAGASHVLVPEMNAGQLVIEIERLLPALEVLAHNRIDGEPIGPAEIADRVRELAK